MTYISEEFHRQITAEKDAYIAELEKSLARARNYKGIEAYPCPLCAYEDGVFIEACQLHKDICELEHNWRTAERDLKEWQAMYRELFHAYEAAKLDLKVLKNQNAYYKIQWDYDITTDERLIAAINLNAELEEKLLRCRAAYNEQGRVFTKLSGGKLNLDSIHE